MVGQTSLHDIAAVGGAGSDGGQSLAGGTLGHLGQGLHTLVPWGNLEDLGQQLLAFLKSLGEGSCGHKASSELKCQLFRHITKWLETLHVAADTLKVSKK